MSRKASLCYLPVMTVASFEEKLITSHNRCGTALFLLVRWKCLFTCDCKILFIKTLHFESFTTLHCADRRVGCCRPWAGSLFQFENFSCWVLDTDFAGCWYRMICFVCRDLWTWHLENWHISRIMAPVVCKPWNQYVNSQ